MSPYKVWPSLCFSDGSAGTRPKCNPGFSRTTYGPCRDLPTNQSRRRQKSGRNNTEGEDKQRDDDGDDEKDSDCGFQDNDDNDDSGHPYWQ